MSSFPLQKEQNIIINDFLVLKENKSVYFCFQVIPENGEGVFEAVLA
jgi:hypothetical protein